MFVPVILGSDKTTVSVATGQNDFYPLYLSIGNIQNNVRRAHRNALVVIGFLAIPKGNCLSSLISFALTIMQGSRGDSNSLLFRRFRRQLFHHSISHILQCLRPYMITPDIVLTPDGHYRRAIYGLGPYIADYPEQVLLAAVVSGWCARYVFHPITYIQC